MNYVEMGNGFKDTLQNVWSFISGIIASILGYFLPVRNIVHVIIIFFILDVALGYWKARKLRKEKFSGKVIWQTTMPRMVISLILVCLAFAWDKEFGQKYIETYNIIGWFISGVLFLSIIQSAYLITDWEMFPLLSKYVKSKMDEKINDVQAPPTIPEKENKPIEKDS